jgi:putative membrane protein
VRQSFFQRRNGLATVVACVGAGSGGYASIDMAATDVAGFALAASEPWAAPLRPIEPATTGGTQDGKTLTNPLRNAARSE